MIPDWRSTQKTPLSVIDDQRGRNREEAEMIYHRQKKNKQPMTSSILAAFAPMSTLPLLVPEGFQAGDRGVDGLPE
jgi:hypothetical protein